MSAAAPRKEEDEAGETPAEGGGHGPAEIGQGAPPGAAEHAPPEAAGADEHDGGVGAADEQLVHDSGGAHDLPVAPLQPARRIDQEALARLEPGRHGIDQGFRPLGRVATLRREIGHLEGPHELHQRQKRRQPVGAGVDQRPQRRLQRQVGEHRRRIDVGRVVGEHERGAPEAAEGRGAIGGHAIPQAEQATDDRPEDPLDSRLHQGPPQTAWFAPLAVSRQDGRGRFGDPARFR